MGGEPLLQQRFSLNPAIFAKRKSINSELCQAKQAKLLKSAIFAERKSITDKLCQTKQAKLLKSAIFAERKSITGELCQTKQAKLLKPAIFAKRKSIISELCQAKQAKSTKLFSPLFRKTASDATFRHLRMFKKNKGKSSKVCLFYLAQFPVCADNLRQDAVPAEKNTPLFLKRVGFLGRGYIEADVQLFTKKRSFPLPQEASAIAGNSAFYFI